MVNNYSKKGYGRKFRNLATGLILGGIAVSGVGYNVDAQQSQQEESAIVHEENLENKLIVKHIRDTCSSSVANSLLNNQELNLELIDEINELNALGVYGAEADSLLNKHNSLYYLGNNHLVGLDSKYEDGTNGTECTTYIIFNEPLEK